MECRERNQNLEVASLNVKEIHKDTDNGNSLSIKKSFVERWTQDNIDSQHQQLFGHNPSSCPSISSTGCDTVFPDTVDQQEAAQNGEQDKSRKMQIDQCDEAMIAYIHTMAEAVSDKASTSFTGISGSFSNKTIASLISKLKSRLEGRRFLDIGAAYGLMLIIFKYVAKCSVCWGYELPDNTSFLHIFEKLVNQVFPSTEPDVHLSLQDVNDVPALKWGKGELPHNPHVVYSYWVGIAQDTRNKIMEAVSRTPSITDFIVTNAQDLTYEWVLDGLNAYRPKHFTKEWSFVCEMDGKMYRSAVGDKKLWIFRRNEEPQALCPREKLSFGLTFETELAQAIHLSEPRKLINAKTSTSTLNVKLLVRLLHQNGLRVKKILGAGGYGVVVQVRPTRGRNAGQTIAIKLETRKLNNQQRSLEDICRSSSLLREVNILRQLEDKSEHSYFPSFKKVFQDWPGKLFEETEAASDSITEPTHASEFPVSYVQELEINDRTKEVIANNVVVAMAMEYSGTTMKKYMHQTCDKIIDNKEITEELRLVCKELLRAVRVMHVKKVIHYDLKAENILMTFDGNENWTGILKIVDFGFSESRNFDHKFPDRPNVNTKKRKSDESNFQQANLKQSKGRGWTALQKSREHFSKGLPSEVVDVLIPCSLYTAKALSESTVHQTLSRTPNSLLRFRPSHAYGTLGHRCHDDTFNATGIANAIKELTTGGQGCARKNLAEICSKKLEQWRLGEAGDMYAIGIVFLRFISSSHLLGEQDKSLSSIIANQSLWMVTQRKAGNDQETPDESVFNSPLAKWIVSCNRKYQSKNRHEVNFSFENFKQPGPISEFLKLITALLNPQADRRMSSLEALCHDFVKFSILPQDIYDAFHSDDGLLVEGRDIFINGKKYATQNLRFKHVPGMGVGIFSDKVIIKKDTLLTFYGGKPGSPEFPNSFTFNIAVKHEGIDGEVTYQWPIERYIKNHCLGSFINSSYNSEKDSESRRDKSVNNVVVFGDYTSGALIKVGDDDVRFQVLATKDIPPGTQLRYYYDINLKGNGKYTQMGW